MCSRVGTAGAGPSYCLPGNHDPVKPGSVFHPDHAFRKLLPDWVHVVDSDKVRAGPDAGRRALCRAVPSMAGAEDLALSLPCRPEGDARIRVGLVHGSTFDMEGYQTSFPIARDAPAQRGLDYLAVGDTHGFRVITESGVAPIVYPGAPEQTRFGESGAGQVALVTLQRSGARPTVTSVKVGRWTWRDESVTSLESLRSLAAEDLSTTVLRLRLDMTVSVVDEKEVDLLTRQLRGDAANFGPRRRVRPRSEPPPCRSRGCRRLDEGRARDAVDRRRQSSPRPRRSTTRRDVRCRFSIGS